MNAATGTALRGRTAADDERAFRAAIRHSRMVRFLRIAIPAGIIAMLGVIAAAAFIKPGGLGHLPIDPGRLGVTDTKITMQAPRLAGFTQDSRPYEVTAASATQDITKPDLLEMQGIIARIEMPDRSVMHMKAQNGVYNSNTEMLWLGHEIDVSSSAGQTGHLIDATIDIKSGKVISDTPVTFKMLNGDLKAKRMEITEGGELVRFENGVELFITFETPQRKASPE
jgi:lipopolysaccharide export system protein LptC